MHLHGVEVHRHLAHAEHRRDAAAPSDQRLDARHQLRQVERLDQVVVRAHVEALQLVLELVAGREHQDGRGELGVLAQALADADAVESRQHHDGVEGLGHGQVHGQQAVGGEVHGVVVGFEEVPHGAREFLVVLHQKYVAFDAAGHDWSLEGRGVKRNGVREAVNGS